VVPGGVGFGPGPGGCHRIGVGLAALQILVDTVYDLAPPALSGVG
jgi:hypothetical protein